MSKLVSDFGAYLKAVFVDGVQKVFTFFDALGVAIRFFPYLGERLSLDESLAKGIGGAIVLASFLMANFSLYTKLVKDKSLGFEIIKVESVSLIGYLLSFSQDQASIEDTFTIHFQALVNISNSGPVTSVRLFLRSIKPDCLEQGLSAGDIEVSLQHQPDPHHQTVKLENPYYLKADEMKNIELVARIPFSTARVEETLGSLSSFTEMEVTIGAEQTGHKPLYRSVHCDLTAIHQGIRREAETKIQHLQNTRLSATQVLEVLERYWGRELGG